MQSSVVQQRSAGRAGVYVLGNDRVSEFLQCALQSIRVFSPALPVWIIPFDQHLDRTRALADRFGARLVEDPSLERLDALGNGLWDNQAYANHMFRKFVAFWGPLETFLYFDVDIASLSDLSELFEVFERSDCEFLSFDNDMNRVYNPGPFREKMIREFGSVGFNAGHFISRRGLFSLPDIQRHATAAKPVRDGFEDKIDQSFWNYVVDVSRVRQKRLPAVDCRYADKQWGDQVPICEMNGRFCLGIPGHRDYGKLMPFIHWSGHQQGDRLPNLDLFYRFRLHGLPRQEAAAYRRRDSWRWATQPWRRRYGWLAQKLKRAVQRLSTGDFSRPRAQAAG